MATQYVVVGMDEQANNHIATALLDKTISAGNLKKGYYKDGNVTILYDLKTNHALMEDVDKHALLVVTKDKLGDYVDFMTESEFLQQKFKLVIFNGNEEMRELPELKTLEEMCKPGCIEVNEGSGLSETRTLIERTVSGDHTASQQTPQQPPSMGNPSSTGKGLHVHVAIIGGPGTGKSRLGNLLLQMDAFESEMYNKVSVTEMKSKHKDELIVYDVPSCDEVSNYKKIKKRLGKKMKDKVVLIYTLRYGSRMTKEETGRVDLLMETFGNEFLSVHLCLALTFGDEFEVMRRQGQVKDFHSYMESNFNSCGLELCQGRCCLVNNVPVTDEAEDQCRQSVLDVINTVA